MKNFRQQNHINQIREVFVKKSSILKSGFYAKIKRIAHFLQKQYIDCLINFGYQIIKQE